MIYDTFSHNNITAKNVVCGVCDPPYAVLPAEKKKKGPKIWKSCNGKKEPAPVWDLFKNYEQDRVKTNNCQSYLPR